MYLHLIFLTNTKIDWITYIQCASSHVSKQAGDMSVVPDEIKSYTVPKSIIDDVECIPNIIVLKNELGEM